MPRGKKLDFNVKYFSERLQSKLMRMLEAAAVYIEAPSGYGKTTAVHELLQKNAAGDKAVWFTAVEAEARAAAWARLCKKLALVDKRVGNGLLALGLPDEDTVGEAAELLGRIECDARCYFVIDNLHLLGGVLPRDVLCALARHGGSALHVIFISQPLAEGSAVPADVPRVGKGDLALSPAEIRAYFARAGIAIEARQAEAVYKNTEGWMAAVYLSLLRLGDGPCENYSAQDVDTLIREVVWERIGEEARSILLLLAPFSCFTKQQLLFVAGLDELGAEGRQALSARGFIRSDAGRGVYYPHALLLEFVRRLFREQSEAYKARAWTRAGRWNERAGNELAAFDCYYAARDFESLFSLELLDVELHSSANGAVEKLEDILESCPLPVKLRHPMTLMSLAYELFAAARCERFLSLCDEIEALIPQTDFSDGEKNRLFGELAMLRSFAAYNDIEKMSEQHRLAYELIGGRARMVDTSAPWAMGCPSVLYMFHSGAGRLSRELGCMECCLPYYLRLAENHGGGAELCMRAEALFYSGSFAEAEIWGMRAAYAAASAREGSILLCAGFLLARVALANGDAAAYASALAQMERGASGGPPSMRVALELAQAHLLLAAGRPDDAAEWVKRGEFGVRGLLAPAIPYAQMLHLYYCLLTGDCRRLFSLGDIFLARAAAQNVLLPQIYNHLLLACAHRREGAAPDAQRCMERALELAAPDSLFAPFAELGADSLPVLSAMPRAEGNGELRELARHMGRGVKKIVNEVYTSPLLYGLTPREHEIALLAARRKSNPEIAALTCLSVATVRTHLRLAYGKMGVDTNSKNKRNLLEQKLKL